MGFIANFKKAVFPPKTCEACGKETDFSVVFCCEIDRYLNVKKRKHLCAAHGLEEVRKALENYSGKVLFAEPGMDKTSGWFFYQPEDLHIHEYSQEDRDKLEDILSGFGSDPHGSDMKWMGPDVIGDCHEEPLFKKGPHDIRDSDASEVICRLQHLLEQLQKKYPRGEFWFTEPRGQQGIYIWDNVV